MPYDIIVRFKDKKTADEFCGQMSNGFGEGFCDFSPLWTITKNEAGKDKYERTFTDTVPAQTQIFEVKDIFEL